MLYLIEVIEASIAKIFMSYDMIFIDYLFLLFIYIKLTVFIVSGMYRSYIAVAVFSVFFHFKSKFVDNKKACKVSHRKLDVIYNTASATTLMSLHGCLVLDNYR